MSFEFPAGHPFAHCSAALPFPPQPTGPSYSAPTLSGPLPPRRHFRVTSPQQTHARGNSSSSSASSSSSNASYFFTLPTHANTPNTSRDSDSESEADFVKRLSSTSTQFGITSQRSSRSTHVNDYASFAAGIEASKKQFGSIGRRGGMDLSERHDRVVEELEVELEDVELRSAVRAVYVGRAN